MHPIWDSREALMNTKKIISAEYVSNEYPPYALFLKVRGSAFFFEMHQQQIRSACIGKNIELLIY